MAVVGNVVWAVTNDGVVSVDRRSRRVAARFSVPGASALAVGLSQLWVVGLDGVYSIHAGKVTKQLAYARGAGELIAVAGGSVWLSACSSNSLRRIEP